MIDYKLDKGTQTNAPTRIVVHAIGEFLEGGDRDMHVTEFLKTIGLSAHLLITPSGGVIRCREDDQGAYHAKGYNTNSLGIEYMVPGVHTMVTFTEAIKEDWVSEKQFESGLRCIKNWYKLWHIQDIDRHSDLSVGRKVDPGRGFPMDRLLNKLV